MTYHDLYKWGTSPIWVSLIQVHKLSNSMSGEKETKVCKWRWGLMRSWFSFGRIKIFIYWFKREADPSTTRILTTLFHPPSPFHHLETPSLPYLYLYLNHHNHRALLLLTIPSNPIHTHHTILHHSLFTHHLEPPRSTLNFHYHHHSLSYIDLHHLSTKPPAIIEPSHHHLQLQP